VKEDITWEVFNKKCMENIFHKTFEGGRNLNSLTFVKVRRICGKI